MVRFAAAMMLWFGCVAAAFGGERVAVVIPPGLLADSRVGSSIDAYVADLAAQGYEPVLSAETFADATSLRGWLAGADLAGAVLVGDLPYQRFEIESHDGWAYDSFPCDLYLQDLDGAWSDADADGILDAHNGDVAPEIWVSRIATHRLTSLQPGRDEPGMIADYFARSHAYRQGWLRVPETSLAYIDDDWADYWGNRWADDLALAGGVVETVIDKVQTTAADYRQQLAENREHLLLCAHSGTSFHSFEGGTGGTVRNDDLADIEPQTLFYNLFACSNARFDVNGFMAGEYVFGEGPGLVAVGSTKTGGMLEFDDYYRPLGAGATFGEAWLAWWDERARYGLSSSERDWHYGMALFGDPLLTTQQFAPPPAALPGDCDGDHDVDTADLAILAAYWNQPGDWAQGDFSGNGWIDLPDLAILSAYWSGLQALPPPSAAPEPTAMLLLLAACPLAPIRRR